MDYYKQIYNDIPEGRKILAKKLISDVTYMDTKLEEYKEIIDRDGLIVSMPQGSYSIDREHPAVKGFHSMVKSRDVIVNRLENLATDKKTTEAEKAGEALKSFISAGKK